MSRGREPWSLRPTGSTVQTYCHSGAYVYVTSSLYGWEFWNLMYLGKWTNHLYLWRGEVNQTTHTNLWQYSRKWYYTFKREYSPPLMGIDPSSFGGKFACLQHASANRDAEKDAQRKHAKKKEKSTSLGWARMWVTLARCRRPLEVRVVRRMWLVKRNTWRTISFFSLNDELKEPRRLRLDLVFSFNTWSNGPETLKHGIMRYHTHTVPSLSHLTCFKTLSSPINITTYFIMVMQWFIVRFPIGLVVHCQVFNWHNLLLIQTTITTINW